MSEINCGYPGDRDETLVAYLYDDIDPADRAAFDGHLATCAPCRAELAALGGVRTQIERWTPPAFERPSAPSAVAAPERWWRDIPAWAQVAAALLVMGVAAGIANLDVRYDRDGLTIRTGWSKTPAAVAASAAAPAPIAPTADGAPWRADLTALEQQLRTEFHASSIAAGAAPPMVRSVSTPNDADLERRVRALIEDSERRQKSELALRVAQVMRDVDAQRRADLVKIDQSLGQLSNNTGVEVMRQRQLLNYLVRVSQKQ